MASTTTVTVSLVLLWLAAVTSSTSLSATVLDAAEILSSSGFETMALNLELASQTLQTPSLTIFAPTDMAFKQVPNLPLSLLRYHLLPHAFSLHSLTSLPFGANIPTLLPSHSLTVTTTQDHRLSLNNVTVNPSPIFHNHHLVIFSTDNFFDPYFQLRARTTTTCSNNLLNDPSFTFHEATRVLRSKGCSLFPSLLHLQILPDVNRRQMTLLAPLDEVAAIRSANLTDYAAILRRHLVPCKLLWNDLVNFEDGTLIGTFERGFSLNVTKDGTGAVLLNGFAVVLPELYQSDWFVVHGIPRVFSARKGRRHRASRYSNPVSVTALDANQSSSIGFDGHSDAENSAMHYHFSIFH